MAKAKREQFFIIKAENIPEEVSIQAVKEFIEKAIEDKQHYCNDLEWDAGNGYDPCENINFNKSKPISWRTMQKVFNVKTGSRGE